MVSKSYKSTEVDRRTWLHVPSGTPWSTSSDTHHVVEIQKETSTKMYKILKSVFFCGIKAYKNLFHKIISGLMVRSYILTNIYIVLNDILI